jgi:hypothetical protein
VAAPAFTFAAPVAATAVSAPTGGRSIDEHCPKKGQSGVRVLGGDVDHTLNLTDIVGSSNSNKFYRMYGRGVLLRRSIACGCRAFRSSLFALVLECYVCLSIVPILFYQQN